MPVIRVKAPATTANLGPGYDCLGLALDVWNTLEVEVIDSGEPVVEVTGEGAGELGTGRDNLVHRAMEFLFDDAGEKMPVVRIRCDNAIPLARGMGSSAAAIAGGLVAANALCCQDYTANDLLDPWCRSAWRRAPPRGRDRSHRVAAGSSTHCRRCAVSLGSARRLGRECRRSRSSAPMDRPPRRCRWAMV